MNEKARSLLEAARRELSRRKVKKALKHISDAIEADPSAHEVLAERAAIAISPLRTYRDAADDMSRAIQMAPQVGDYYDLRGQAYWYLREYERAYEDFNKAIEVDPACARAYYHRGNFAEKLQRYESAIEDMKRAVELDPESRSYKRRLDELKRAATRHAERVGEEPPASAIEEPAALEKPAALEEPAAPEEAPIEEAELAEEPEAEAEAPEEEAVAAEAPAAKPEPAPAKMEGPPVHVAPPLPEAAAEKWSVRIATGERFGPVSMAVLKLWAEEQRVKPEDHLQTPKGGWVAAKNVAEIAAVFESLRTTRKPPVRPD